MKQMKTDSDENKTCPKCHMPLEKKGSGSLTQWIKVCNCGRPEMEQLTGAPINICTTCGKRIEGGRTGTLTQWIFRADLCTCDVPTWAKDQMQAAGETGPAETIDELNEIEELQLEPGSFPVERYAPIRCLGMGASGTVYLCKDRLLNKKVAVKVLNNLSSNQLVAFQREAKATSQILHPNIVKVLDFGVSDGKLPFMVLEYVDGLSLLQVLEQQHTLTIEEAIPIFSQICDGLRFAHDRNLYHRDLKPTNILVVGWGREDIDVRIIDFGVGVIKQEKTAQGTTVAGSPPYMSPDQAVGLPFDERSEIYSLGCVMFEALTGQPPFLGETALNTISLHAHEQPRTLSQAHGSLTFPDAVESVIATCLKKSPAERYKNMAELKLALREILDHSEDDRSIEASIAAPVSSDAKKNWAVLSITAVLVCTIGGALIFGQWLGKSDTTPSAPKKKKYQEPKLNDALDSLISSETWYKGSSVDGQIVWTSRPNLKDKDLKLVLKEQDVKRITIGITDYITGMGFKDFQNKGLVSIIVQSTGLTDEGLTVISKLKTLQDLRTSLSSKLTAGGIKSLATLPDLRQLSLNHMKIPTGTFAEVSKIKTLQSLAVYNSSNIKLDDLQNLSKLPALEYLDVSSTNLKNDALPVIAKIKSIVELRLGNLDLTDDNLEQLAKLPNLACIGLERNNRLTERGLAKLEKCKNLEVLMLEHCDGISKLARTKFMKRNPRVGLGTVTDTSVELEDSLGALRD